MNESTKNLMFSSKTNEWSTPQDFYNKLATEFAFTLDPCCTPPTAKCKAYYTEEDDGLSKSWEGHTVFMNPPYGRGIKDWIHKAYEEGKKDNTVVVALIPSRTDTKYWHACCMNAKSIRFIKGRLKFGDSKNAAPFPSAVVVFDGDNTPIIAAMTAK
jgi:phage N-6-adenine-methyltransferase